MEKAKIPCRVHEINMYLLQSIKTYRLRKVGADCTNGKKAYAYAISLVRRYDCTLEEQIKNIYATLRGLLLDEEVLTVDKKSFRVISSDFEIYYCVEVWRKRADRTAYIEDGQVKVEFLHRMSCEEAAKIFKKYKVAPLKCINKPDELRACETPADKYVALAKTFLWTAGTKRKGERNAVSE